MMTQLLLWRWLSKALVNSRNVLPGLSFIVTINLFCYGVTWLVEEMYLRKSYNDI